MVDGGRQTLKEWQADRQLAKELLKWLEEQFASEQAQLKDISGIGVFTGPGSFTGLRIGLTVMNTLSDGLSVPIVGETGEGWQAKALERLARGENDKVAMPNYGAEANITTPRK